jgi:hypothetical protein
MRAWQTRNLFMILAFGGLFISAPILSMPLPDDNAQVISVDLSDDVYKIFASALATGKATAISLLEQASQYIIPAIVLGGLYLSIDEMCDEDKKDNATNFICEFVANSGNIMVENCCNFLSS